MPWEKNFDVEETIGKAMQVFWEKGYEGASIADLTEATGVKRQSLYNAIGDKRRFFVRSLLKYDTENRQATLASLEARGEPRQAIVDLFAGIAQEAIEDPARRGCFLVNTALELARHDDEVRTLVTSALEDFRAFFERMIEHGKVRGEIPETVDAAAAASGLLGLFLGIRVLARGAGERVALQQMAAQATRLLG